MAWASRYRSLVKRRDRAPDTKADPARHLIQSHHVVREEDQHRIVVRIGLPPTAESARPTNRADAAATLQHVGVRRLHDDRDAHAVAVSRGEDGPSEHASRRALL